MVLFVTSLKLPYANNRISLHMVVHYATMYYVCMCTMCLIVLIYVMLQIQLKVHTCPPVTITYVAI